MAIRKCRLQKIVEGKDPENIYLETAADQVKMANGTDSVESSIASMLGSVSQHDTKLVDLSNDISENTGSIAAIDTRVGVNERNITGLGHMTGIIPLRLEPVVDILVRTAIQVLTGIHSHTHRIASIIGVMGQMMLML